MAKQPRTNKQKEPMGIRKTMCPTCPFKAGADTEYLKEFLTRRVLTEQSHICHSTGANNAFYKKTGIPELFCRGARQLQIRFFHTIGLLKEPTLECWNEERVKLGMAPQQLIDPGLPLAEGRHKD